MQEQYYPGPPLYHYGTQYGFERHLQEYGNGTNCLRTERLAQPTALKPGDILATGIKVIFAPTQGYNSIPLLLTEEGWPNHWIGVASRIPIALQTAEDRNVIYHHGVTELRTERWALPASLRRGDIIATGDEILRKPKKQKDGSVIIMLTGGWHGHTIDVPAQFPIALLTPEDHAPEELWELHVKEKPRKAPWE